MSDSPRICVTITEHTVEAAHTQAQLAARRGADLVEIRADFIRGLTTEAIPGLLNGIQVPAIFTLRIEAEGGEWQGEDVVREGLYLAASGAGFAYLDIELASAPLFERIRKSVRAQTILSYHNFEKTEANHLKQVYQRMRALGPDVVKLAAFANSDTDRWTLLKLLHNTVRDVQPAVVIGMGPVGRMSRVVFPLLGGSWTYACLREQAAAAPGQYPLAELQEIYRRMGEKA